MPLLHPGPVRQAPAMSDLPAVLAFHGAAGTVTGSRFLLDLPSARVLVDCGLFQGLKALRRRNWEPFPIGADSIDAVVLTHAHVDHCGFVPRLVRDGFRGPVFATSGTAALAAIVLPDAGHLQEEEAAYANRAGYSKHQPAEPLFTEIEAQASLRQLHPTPFAETIEVAPGVHVTFRPAGHILGSSIVTVDIDDHGGRTVVFSGDLGRDDHPLLVPPAPPDAADLMLVESTYGDRLHDDEDSLTRFTDVVARTLRRRGTVLIPAFAVDRTEVVLRHLAELTRSGAIPSVPVYVDSPMALRSLRTYRDALRDHADDVRTDVGDDIGGGLDLRETPDVEGSKDIDRHHGAAIVISASGMATGGRVLHHLARHLPDPRSAVVLVGYQAAGTRGRALADGARSVKLLGSYVRIEAEVAVVDAYSSHADQAELLAWLARAPRPPETLFVVHGEPDAAMTLRDQVDETLGWTAVVARHGERVLVAPHRT